MTISPPFRFKYKFLLNATNLNIYARRSIVKSLFLSTFSNHNIADSLYTSTNLPFTIDELRRNTKKHRGQPAQLDSQLRKMREEWTRTLSQIKRQLVEGRKEIKRTLVSCLPWKCGYHLKRTHRWEAFRSDIQRSPSPQQVSNQEFH